MTPFWEAEIPRLLAKVAQLSFDAAERSAEIERLRAERDEMRAERDEMRAALGSAGYARALKECDELRAENGRLRAYARRIAAAPSAGRPGARPMTTDFQDAAADLGRSPATSKQRSACRCGTATARERCGGLEMNDEALARALAYLEEQKRMFPDPPKPKTVIQDRAYWLKIYPDGNFPIGALDD